MVAIKQARAFHTHIGSIKPLTEEHRMTIEANAPLVKWLAAKMARPGESYDDLISDAFVGLTLAVQAFDPARGMVFTTYAVIRMRWEILAGRSERSRALRGYGWGEDEFEVPAPANGDTLDDDDARVVSELVRRGLQNINPRYAEVAELHYFHGMSPTEIGRRFGVSRERIRQLLAKAHGKLSYEPSIRDAIGVLS